MIGELQRYRRSLVTLVLLAVTVATLVVFGATPARADEEIEFRIVFQGQDQGCRTGSNKLSAGAADPFLVDACALEFGDGLENRALTAIVTHSDGTTEEFVVTTGPDGSVRFEVVPVGVGVTTVEMCNEESCDFGVLEFEASGPPSPPLVASYFGPTNDMGESAYIEDGEDDFDDPHSGGPAAPGTGDPAMDITSFRYLGAEDGRARFEINTVGDVFALFSSDLPMVQVTMAVTTPAEARYLISYRVVSGEIETFASSDGAELEDVVIEIEEGSLILIASGVDVLVGSLLRAGLWVIVDPDKSGLQDFADGTAMVALTETNDPALTASGAGEEQQDDSGLDSATPVPASTDGGGGFPGLIFLIGGMTVVVGGGFWWWLSGRDPTADDSPGTYTDAGFPGIITNPRGDKKNPRGNKKNPRGPKEKGTATGPATPDLIDR